MQFKKRIEEYKLIQKEKKEGKLHYIPFHDHLPKFSSIYPGIIPKSNLIITSSTGSGKSKQWRFFGIKIPYDVVKSNPDISFKFIGNCLEEPIEEIIDHLVIQRIKEKYNVYLDMQSLSGFRKEYVLDEHIELIDKELDYFNDLDKYIILENESNPYGFYKKIRSYAFKNGTFYYENKSISREKEPDWTKVKWDTYVPDNPKEIVIIGVDHNTLFNQENKMSKYETIVKWSQVYLRRIINLKFGYASISVHQQAVDQESLNFTNKGDLIIQKLKPSIANFGDVRVIARDATEIIGLFSPYRYEIDTYKKGGTEYDIKNDFKHLFKEVIMIKSRKSTTFSVPMWLDPISETLHEINVKQYNREKEADYSGEYVYKNLWKKYVNVF